MRILYHHRTTSRDGQEVHISELVAALRAAGHAVRVLSPGGEEAGARMGGHRAGLGRLRAVLPGALLPLAARAYDAVFTRRAVAAARRFGAEVIYERHALQNRVGVRAARRLGLPLLLEVNAPLSREEAAEGRLGRLERALAAEIETLRAADAVLVVTRVLKEILVGDGVEAARIHVIPNAVDPARFLGPRDERARQRWKLADRLVLGFVGFPRPWHRLDLVVEALAAARHGQLAEAVLLIGGEGPALEPVLALARRLGVGQRVVCRGVLGRDEVASFIDAFDIALQPHATGYASPLKLFEYLARGVAVIAPRQPNIEEVLVHGESGFLFEPLREGAFGDALARLAADAGLRRRLGEGGRRLVAEGGFTWERNAERVAELAGGLVMGRAGGRR